MRLPTVCAPLFAIVVAWATAGCGGGEGEPAPRPAEVYAGIWEARSCGASKVTTLTITATGSSAMSISQRVDYYRTQDCSGLLSGTGIYPTVTVSLESQDKGATIRMFPPDRADVDIGTMTDPGGVLAMSGPGVSFISIVAPAYWIQTDNQGGATAVLRDLKPEIAPRGFAISGDNLYVLPVPGPYFPMDAYKRRSAAKLAKAATERPAKIFSSR